MRAAYTADLTMLSILAPLTRPLLCGMHLRLGVLVLGVLVVGGGVMLGLVVGEVVRLARVVGGLAGWDEHGRRVDAGGGGAGVGRAAARVVDGGVAVVGLVGEVWVARVAHRGRVGGGGGVRGAAGRHQRRVGAVGGKAVAGREVRVGRGDRVGRWRGGVVGRGGVGGGGRWVRDRGDRPMGRGHRVRG